MHEEDFLSSWLSEDVEGEAEQMEKMNRETNAEECKSGKMQVGGTKGKGSCVLPNTLAVNFLRVWNRELVRRVWTRKWWICREMRVSVGVRCVCVCALFCLCCV